MMCHGFVWMGFSRCESEIILILFVGGLDLWIVLIVEVKRKKVWSLYKFGCIKMKIFRSMLNH